MNKRLIDRFTEDYERNLSNNCTRIQSFENAKKDFERVCGFTPYTTYNSYKSAKCQDRNKMKYGI